MGKHGPLTIKEIVAMRRDAGLVSVPRSLQKGVLGDLISDLPTYELGEDVEMTELEGSPPPKSQPTHSRTNTTTTRRANKRRLSEMLSTDSPEWLDTTNTNEGRGATGSPLRKKRRLRVSLTDQTQSQTSTRTNTVSHGIRTPFTVLLWNVENYGENKSHGNPFANRVIRYVLDELDVDVVVLLETQSAPTDVVTGVERRLVNPMRTVKEKSRGSGMDITFKSRFTKKEKQELEQDRLEHQIGLRLAQEDDLSNETDLRQLIEDEFEDDEFDLDEFIEGALQTRLNELQEGGSTFQPITSGVTGKQRELPKQMGPYRYWPRGSDLKDKRNDISRLKKLYSFIGSRKEPSPEWLLSYVDDLADVYDLRLRVNPDYEEEKLTRPLTRKEITRLRRCVRAMCFDKSDLEYWRRKEEQLDELEDNLRHLHNDGNPLLSIDDELDRLEEEGNGFDPSDTEKIHSLLNSENIDIDEIEDELVLAKEDRREATERLLELEISAVFTLKDSARATARDSKSRTFPPRQVIGFQNEGNTCYLNSVLQFLGAVDTEAISGTSQANAELARGALDLIEAARAQASKGRYASSTSEHPELQEGPESNWLRDRSTHRLRQRMCDRWGWTSIYGSEDAHEALVSLLEAIAPDDTFSSEQILNAYNDQDLNRLRITPSHFFVQYVNQLDWKNREWQQDAKAKHVVEAVRMNDDVAHVRAELLNVLSLPVPVGDKRTLDQAYLEFMNPAPVSDRLRVRLGGNVYTATSSKQMVSVMGDLPVHLFIRIERIRICGDKKTGLRKEKFDGPIAMCTEIRNDGIKRELVAFIVHHGKTVDDGHYTAYRKIDRQWFHLNDRTVTPIADEVAGEARNKGYLYYYAPPSPLPLQESSTSDDEDMDMDMDMDMDIEEETSSSVSSVESSEESDSSEDESEPSELQLFTDILEYEPQDESVIPSCRLPEPKELTHEQVVRIQDMLSGMIGVRNVETYTVLFRCDDKTRGKVGQPIMSANHPNVGHYVFKQSLLSKNSDGEELGFQDPSSRINGRCPFYFELDVWKDKSDPLPVRLPIVALHAPYSLPAAFRTQEPRKGKEKKKSDDGEELQRMHSLIDFDGNGEDAENALRMRSEALQALLELGIPSSSSPYEPRPMKFFSDALIVGDFNLDMKKRESEQAVSKAYTKLESFGFEPMIDKVGTTMHAVESMLASREDESSKSEEQWYGSAYDNIFVKSGDLPIAYTKQSLEPVAGAVDVFDVMVRHWDDIAEGAEGIIKNTANYRDATKTARRRARNELARWNKNKDPRARAYFLYRKYVSDHLPVFVDLDIQGDFRVRAHLPSRTSSDNVPRAVIGITNGGNTCYLNATLQLLYALGTMERWADPAGHDYPTLYRWVADFLEGLSKEAALGAYSGQGDEFSGAGDKKRSYSQQNTHGIRRSLEERSGGMGGRFALGVQEDAVEALDSILQGCARPSSDGSRDDALDLSPRNLAAAASSFEPTTALAALRPSPIYFFVRKVLTYEFEDEDEDEDEQNDGLQLDETQKCAQIECQSILRLSIDIRIGVSQENPKGNKITTLQQAWDAARSRLFAGDDREPARVRFAGTTYNGKRVREDLELLAPPPDHLLVQLKRFVWKETKRSSKEKRDYEQKKNTDSVSAAKGLFVEDTQYDVVGIVRHTGYELGSGHYIAYLKIGEYWYEANDQTVTRAPPKIGDAMEHGYLYLLRRHGVQEPNVRYRPRNHRGGGRSASPPPEGDGSPPSFSRPDSNTKKSSRSSKSSFPKFGSKAGVGLVKLLQPTTVGLSGGPHEELRAYWKAKNTQKNNVRVWLRTAYWSRAEAKARRDYLYVFGDNQAHSGKSMVGSGQAVIRPEPNAFGLVSLTAPGGRAGHLLYDDSTRFKGDSNNGTDLAKNRIWFLRDCKRILDALATGKYTTLVISFDQKTVDLRGQKTGFNIGCGIAPLNRTKGCEQTFESLLEVQRLLVALVHGDIVVDG